MPTDASGPAVQWESYIFCCKGSKQNGCDTAGHPSVAALEKEVTQRNIALRNKKKTKINRLNKQKQVIFSKWKESSQNSWFAVLDKRRGQIEEKKKQHNK